MRPSSVYSHLLLGELSNGFPRHPMHCLVERSLLTASSQVAFPSVSLRVHFLVTMTLALVSTGPSTSALGPMSCSLGVTAEELDLAVVHRLPLLTQGTTPVWTALPHLPLLVVPQEGAIPLALVAKRQATVDRKSICITGDVR